MFDIFSLKDFKFPKDFFFGSATAAHQIEGDNFYSDRYEKEQREYVNSDIYEPSGKAVNHYEMYREDAKLLKDLHHQVFRMGVEWARIEKENGVFDENEIDHYVKELEYLNELGIKVCVTLVHFSIPQWFNKLGGFYEYENIKYFERYLEKIVPKISKYVSYWCVMNEFNFSINTSVFKRNSIRFHALGYKIIKKYSNAPVSSAHALEWCYPKRANDVFDRVLAEYRDITHNEFFFHAIRTGEIILPDVDAVYDKEIKDTCDFWAVNTYVRHIVDSRKANKDGVAYPFARLKMINMDFYLEELNPECMYQNLLRLKDKPVIITENGVSSDYDDFRIAFIAEYLTAIKCAMDEGVDVIGYLHWSFLDNYEWNSFIPRFGLVDVDRKNGFKRTPKNSAYFLRDIIDNNGFSQEILRKYLKEMPKLNK